VAPHREETRRDFLLRLARTAPFVPPAMATLDVRPLLAQGGSTSGGKTSTSSSSTVGSLSPTAQTVSQPTFQLESTSSTSSAPWDASGPTQVPPWSRPPPGTDGR